MRIVVGSTALGKFNLNRRKPSDVDIWTDEFSYSPSEKEDVALVPSEILSKVDCTDDGFATPDSVYTIKLSHLVYDIQWQKHKLDVLFLKINSCKVLPKLYELLIEHWKVVHGAKDFLSLNKDKIDFFDDAVHYQYEHDHLHELVAFPNKPVYTKCLKEGQDVLIDKEKFFSMCFDDQVRMFREEIAVIAIERWLVDPKYESRYSWYQAHMFSVRKTVTSLTKGWASRFLVENIEHFVKPNYSYYKHIMKELSL